MSDPFAKVARRSPFGRFAVRRDRAHAVAGFGVRAPAATDAMRDPRRATGDVRRETCSFRSALRRRGTRARRLSARSRNGPAVRGCAPVPWARPFGLRVDGLTVREGSRTRERRRCASCASAVLRSGGAHEAHRPAFGSGDGASRRDGSMPRPGRPGAWERRRTQ